MEPAQEDAVGEILADPREEQGVDSVRRLDEFIQNSQWVDLEVYLISIMPKCQDNSHPSLLHPMLFLTVWRRQVKDLLDAEMFEQAKAVFDEKIAPLKLCITPYAYSEKLSSDIESIEDHVQTRARFEHIYCETILMQKLVNDYLRLYLPDAVRYVRPKNKHSAMWEFAVRLDTPTGVKNRHPDIRCLVCSQVEYVHCKVGVTMTEHLKVCVGLTPQSQARYNEAVRKESHHRRPLTSLPAKKILNLTASHGASSTQSGQEADDPLHMFNQKVEEGKKILLEMKSKQQQPEVIWGKLSALGSSALQHVPRAAATQPVPPAANVAAAPAANVSAAEPAAVPMAPIAADIEPAEAPPAALPVHVDGPVPDYFHQFDDSTFLPDLPELSE